MVYTLSETKSNILTAKLLRLRLHSVLPLVCRHQLLETVNQSRLPCLWVDYGGHLNPTHWTIPMYKVYTVSDHSLRWLNRKLKSTWLITACSFACRHCLFSSSKLPNKHDSHQNAESYELLRLGDWRWKLQTYASSSNSLNGDAEVAHLNWNSKTGEAYRLQGTRMMYLLSEGKFKSCLPLVRSSWEISGVV